MSESSNKVHYADSGVYLQPGLYCCTKEKGMSSLIYLATEESKLQREFSWSFKMATTTKKIIDCSRKHSISCLKILT